MSDDFRKLDQGDEPEDLSISSPYGWEYLSDGGQIRCVFSTTKTIKMGTGADARKHESMIYWFVEQLSEERFEARIINIKCVPEGNAELIPLHTLIKDYKPELAFYEDSVLPAMEDLDEILDQGDEYREDGELYSAEMEYERACTIEKKNVRALFGLGLVYSSRKEVGRTRALLAELVGVKAAFDGKNQHLFNEFGISLRKSELFNEAIVYYRRGLDFVKNDEHLYYNLARAHYEDGDWNGCLDGLIMSHRLNPGLGVARDLFELMVGLAEDERLLRRYGKPPVPSKVLMRAKQILAVETGKLSLDDGPIYFSKARGRARGGRDVMGDNDVDIVEIDDVIDD